MIELEEKIWKYKKDIIILGLFLSAIIILLFLMNNPEMVADAVSPGWDENPFDYIRETEERVIINGTILHVEYIDWEKCELFMENGWDYSFNGDAFGDLKKHEGERVTILCYTQGWDGLYRLYPCNDWEMGYVKTINL